MFFRFVISRLFIHMTNKLSSAFVWNVYLVDALFSCLHGYSAFGCYACSLYFFEHGAGNASFVSFHCIWHCIKTPLWRCLGLESIVAVPCSAAVVYYFDSV